MHFRTAATTLAFTTMYQMFEDNGIEIPKTWEEFTAVCDKLQEAGITPVGMHGKDPSRVGHLFQAATVAWAPNGVETIGKAVAGEATIEGDAEFQNVFEKMSTLLSYANEDALALSDTACYENFANGQYAMTITGSYAKGTIQSINSDLKIGIFPLPNDTYEDTKCLSGIDAQSVYLHRPATKRRKLHIVSLLIWQRLRTHRPSVIVTAHRPVSMAL